jgi:hypothetical protein
MEFVPRMVKFGRACGNIQGCENAR